VGAPPADVQASYAVRGGPPPFIGAARGPGTSLAAAVAGKIIQAGKVISYDL